MFGFSKTSPGTTGWIFPLHHLISVLKAEETQMEKWTAPLSRREDNPISLEWFVKALKGVKV